MLNHNHTFRNGLDGPDFPSVVIFWAFSIIGFVVGLLCSLPPSLGAWTLILMFGSIAVFGITTLLYNTSIYRTLKGSRLALWNNYIKLNGDTRKRINLTIETVLAADNIIDLNEQVSELVDIQKKRITQASSGPVVAAKQAIEAELEFERRELELL